MSGTKPNRIQASALQRIKAIHFASADKLVLQAAASGKAIPTFEMQAYDGGKMQVPGWTHPVVIELRGMRIDSQLNPVRSQHDPLQGVGHTERVFVKDNRLYIAGKISRDTPIARDIVSSSKKGFPWKAAIGTTTERYKFIRSDEQVVLNGQKQQGPFFHVIQSSFDEVSFVDFGDASTSATISSSHATSSPQDAKATWTLESLQAIANAEAERIIASIHNCKTA